MSWTKITPHLSTPWTSISNFPIRDHLLSLHDRPWEVQDFSRLDLGGPRRRSAGARRQENCSLAGKHTISCQMGQGAEHFPGLLDPPYAIGTCFNMKYATRSSCMLFYRVCHCSKLSSGIASVLRT